MCLWMLKNQPDLAMFVAHVTCAKRSRSVCAGPGAAHPAVTVLNGLGCQFSCCVIRLRLAFKRPVICVLSCFHYQWPSRPSRGNPDCLIIWGTSQESSLWRGHRHSGQKVSPLKGGADTSFSVSQWRTISFFHFPFQWVLICWKINNNTRNKQTWLVVIFAYIAEKAIVL